MAPNIARNFNRSLVGRPFVNVPIPVPPPPLYGRFAAAETEEKEEKKKVRCLLDIELNDLTEGDPPASAALASSSGVVKAKVTGERVLESRRRRWTALVDAAEVARREYEGDLGRAETEFRTGDRSQSQRRYASVCELVKKVAGDRRRSMGGACGYDVDVAAASPPPPPPPPPPVLRSTRGRVVALPSKYRDSVLGVEAEFPRSDKSAAAVAAETGSPGGCTAVWSGTPRCPSPGTMVRGACVRSWDPGSG